jgi:hypothetical protein
MIDSHELQMINIGDFAEFLRETDTILAIDRRERFAGDLNVLVVIDGEVLSVA